MQTSPKNGSATLPSRGRYEQAEESASHTSEVVYQCLTVAAMVLVLASLWVF
jgi:hypothetical protein